MMLVITLSAVVLCLIMVYVIMRLSNELLYVRDELQMAADAEHAKCMGAVMKFVGDQWAAQVLEVAAADYESAANHADIDRIGRLLWRPDGSPVPSIWMRERAEKLRIWAEPEPEPNSLEAAIKHVEGMNFNEVVL